MDCSCASMSYVLSTALGEMLGMGGSGFDDAYAGLAGTSDAGMVVTAMETQISGLMLMVVNNSAGFRRPQEQAESTEPSNFLVLYLVT